MSETQLKIVYTENVFLQVTWTFQEIYLDWPKVSLTGVQKIIQFALKYQHLLMHIN